MDTLSGIRASCNYLGMPLRPCTLVQAFPKSPEKHYSFKRQSGIQRKLHKAASEGLAVADVGTTAVTE